VSTAPNDFLRECMALPAFADAALRVLCIGDGEGRNGAWLARRPGTTGGAHARGAARS